MVSAERFASGMTFEQYVRYTGSPENLKREGSQGERKDWSDFLRAAHASARLTDAQEQAWKWLAARPGGPAKVLVLSEEWSSDCRRDVPMVAKVADVAGFDLRIFPRDGQRFSTAPAPSPAESPNADLMAQFLNHRNGQTWQSIPVVAFYTRSMEHLYTYIEFPAIYHKDRVVGAIRATRPGETADDARTRGAREFMELQASPFFRIWAGAGVDEMATMLHERMRVGSLA